MPANTAPIFPITPNTPVGKTILTANTAQDGTGTVVTLFTAGANGGRVDYIKFMPIGTNVATVARVFINNGLTTATAANNAQFAQITLPASTISQTAALTEQLLTLNLSIPAGYILTLAIGTTVAAGYAVTAVGGDY